MSTRILSVFSHLKRVGFAVLLLGVSYVAHAQTYEPKPPLDGTGKNTVQCNQVSVLEDTREYTILKFTLDSIQLKKEIRGQDTCYRILAPHLRGSYDPGKPALKWMFAEVILNRGGKPTIELLDTEYEDRPNILIAPIDKDMSSTQRFEPDTFVYCSKFPYPSEIVKISNPYVMRDIYGATGFVTPFQLFPEAKTLRIYRSVTVKIYSNATSSKPEWYELPDPPKVAGEFLGIYLQFINSRERFRNLR